MQQEVKHSETLAISLSIIAGILIFNANLLIYVAAQVATENDQNMAVVTAIANGTIPLGLLGSKFIYKEKLTILQIAGSMGCMAGILILSLSVLRDQDADVISFIPGTSLNQEGNSKAMRIMIIDAFVSMVFLGARINMAKYCTRIVSSLTYLKLQLCSDFCCAMFILMLSAIQVINVPIELYIDKETL